MFSESAGLYDLIYLKQKDYAADARAIASLIQREKPGARSILDVACGTGEHARILRDKHGFEVDGVDLDEKLLSFARGKNPTAAFTCADMKSFDLSRKYDVVMCLFSSIGYVKTLKGLSQALDRFKAHLSETGLMLIEPWFGPVGLSPGRMFLETVETPELTVARMGYTEIDGALSLTRFEYLIGAKGKIKRASETHRLGLFSKEQMQSAFLESRLAATFYETGFSGRGLYVARKG